MNSDSHTPSATNPSFPGASMGASTSRPSDESEPTSGSAHVPSWLIMFVGILIYGGQLYLADHAGEFHPQVYEPFKSYDEVAALTPKGGIEALVAKGQAVYQICAACHQANGLGQPGAFPPLVGSEWVLEKNPSRLIRIPLHGLTGPITVKGQALTANMAALGDSTFREGNEDLAAVLTYIRQAWGNNAPPVTVEQVKTIRDETKDRPENGARPWTAEELLKIPVE